MTLGLARTSDGMRELRDVQLGRWVTRWMHIVGILRVSAVRVSHGSLRPEVIEAFASALATAVVQREVELADIERLANPDSGEIR